MVKKEKDNLAALLVLIAEHYKIKTNQNQLTAGLPLVNGRLTPDLFIRSAAKIKLYAKLAKRSLNKISSLLLPAIINLKNEDCLLLTKIDLKKNSAHIVTPDKIKKIISLPELEEIFDGTVFLISDNYKFDVRSSDTQGQKMIIGFGNNRLILENLSRRSCCFFINQYICIGRATFYHERL